MVIGRSMEVGCGETVDGEPYRAPAASATHEDSSVTHAIRTKQIACDKDDLNHGIDRQSYTM